MVSVNFFQFCLLSDIKQSCQSCCIPFVHTTYMVLLNIYIPLEYKIFPYDRYIKSQHLRRMYYRRCSNKAVHTPGPPVYTSTISLTTTVDNVDNRTLLDFTLVTRKISAYLPVAVYFDDIFSIFIELARRDNPEILESINKSVYFLIRLLNLWKFSKTKWLSEKKG